MENKLSFLGGIVAGALVGSALTMMIDPVSDKQRRRLQKGTNAMFKTVGTILDSIIK